MEHVFSRNNHLDFRGNTLRLIQRVEVVSRKYAESNRK